MQQQKKQKQKSYIVVYFAIALVVVIIAVAGTIFGIVKHNQNKKNPTTAKTTVSQEEKESGEEKSKEATAKIQMTGDVLLHQTTAGDTVPGAAKSGGTYDFHKYFSEVDDYIDADMALCDIEGTVDIYGDNKDLAYYPQFNLPHEILPCLKDLGFTGIVTANNHIWDYSSEGAYATVENIKKEGLLEFGTYASEEATKKPYIVDVNGIKVGVLAWTDSTNGSYMDEEHINFITKTFNSDDIASADKILEDVKILQDNGAEFIIACLHWGVEYQDEPGDTQRQIAKKLIDGGVDFIMGNHPHCLQPMEKLSTKRGDKTVDRYVTYALGNFIGDQIVLDKEGLKTQQAAIVTIQIKKNSDGSVDITSGEYLPVLTHAYYQDGVKNDYKVLPMTALKDKPIPCAYASEDYFASSYERVTKLLGNALPVSKFAAGKQMPENT
ncbi:MAG: CapA family protein [Clostridia bacterium]|nr:CapA family protein [Clostridia bacterium]